MSATKAKTKAPRAAKTIFATAEEIAIHPLLAALPVTHGVVARLASDAKKAKGGQLADKKELHADAAESWGAFVADLKKRGVVETMTVVKVAPAKGSKIKFHLVDGRDRFTGGQEAGLKKFPLKITTEDPATFILGAQKRKHWSKQQLAYFALHVCPHLIEGAKPGPKPEGEIAEKIGELPDRETLAASIGVSRDTVDIAARVHVMFRKDASARRKYEPLIFAGVALTGIISGKGAESSQHGKGDTRGLPHLRLRDAFTRQSNAIVKEWDAVVAEGGEAQAEVKESLTAFLLALPLPLLEHTQNHFEEEAA